MVQYAVFYRNVSVYLRTLPGPLKVASEGLKRRNQVKEVRPMLVQIAAEHTLNPGPALYTPLCNYVTARGVRPAPNRARAHPQTRRQRAKHLTTMLALDRLILDVL